MSHDPCAWLLMLMVVDPASALGENREADRAIDDCHKKIAEVYARYAKG